MKKILVVLTKLFIFLLPVFILIFSFFYNKIYVLKLDKNIYNEVIECLKNDNISFENSSQLEKIEVSKPTFSDTEKFTFFYSDNKIYYNCFDINDKSNLKTYIENNCFNIRHFISVLFVLSCIVAILQILISIIKFFIKLISNLIK